MRFLAFLLAPIAAVAADKPNVIFILADDLGAHDLGCFGSTFYETPNLDRLAKRGTRFTQAYAASPLCSPTRSSILVGQYPARTGITAPVCHLPTVQLEKNLAENENGKTRMLVANSITRLKPEYFTSRLPKPSRQPATPPRISASGTSDKTSKQETPTNQRIKASTLIFRTHRAPLAPVTATSLPGSSSRILPSRTRSA